ncbi:MAG: acetoacetate decarboxylase family protein [Acidimicrobiia bacterium]
MLTGTAPLDELVAHAATMPSFDTEALTLPDAEVFQAMFESHIGGREASLPPSLHPTAVPTFIVQVWRCPDSPWGPFSLAQGRVGARSGLRPRGHVQACVCDNEEVTEALRTRWGFPARSGTVSLRHHYDAVEASVVVGGNTVVSVRGSDPEPLGTGDIAYSQTVALAHTPRGLRLVQIEYDIAVTRAERLHPRLDAFDAEGFGVHPTVQPYHAVSASIALGAITLHRLRFVCRPEELAFTGTEPIDQ